MDQPMFTAVDYQHQDSTSFRWRCRHRPRQLDLSQGRIDRVAATANLWIGGGIGAFATLAYADFGKPGSD